MSPKVFTRNFHWFVTATLALLLVPSFHAARLPLRFAWGWSLVLLAWFWTVSILYAAALFAIGSPRDCWAKLSRRGPSGIPSGTVPGIVVPAVYFFFGFLLVESYNDVIAVLRFNGRGDAVLARADRWLLGGHTVPQVAHLWVLHFPRTLPIMQFVYLQMFYFIGACVLIVALKDGMECSVAFIGAVMTAYYLSLLLFYALAATGPYLNDGALSGNLFIFEMVCARLRECRELAPFDSLPAFTPFGA